MVFYGDIISSRGYSSIYAKSGRKTPILVVNNEYSNVNDPMLDTAKEAAINDMLQDITYIHPEIVEGD
jgi:hypothetical protein|tara:strand:+ start:374 stop:577 length:204 start_codon:yes stop_codon:yes gene_type:complete